MRMFDSRNSWLDNEGKPLVGRVKFCKLHTTVLENIYNMNGTVVLANPQYTNTIGQLDNQVFLKDNTDYTVRFEKYIGNGDMSEDQDNWQDVYSCDNIWNTYGIEVDSTTFQLVNNVNDLRACNPSTITTRDNHKVVILGGYNEIGDKPQVMYIWNASSIDNDNGGSVIKVDTIATGRWELCNTFGSEGVDVRHFGVFGADSKSDATDLMSLKISVANTYAASIGLPIYFPTIHGVTWYKFNNLNIAGAKFAKDTKIFGNTGTSSIITVYSENEYLDVYNNSDYNAVFTIRGQTVKTSWGVNSNNCEFEPSYKLIVDSIINTYNNSFYNIIVDCQYEIVGCQFTNCEIHSVEKLGDDNMFVNCYLSEQMFTDGVDFETITVTDSDIINIDDWPTTNKWLTLVAQQSNNVLDFKGRTVDSSCELNWIISAVYKNAAFSGFTVKQKNITFYDCNGTVNLNDPIENITMYDSSIIFTPTGVTVRNTLYAKNSAVTFGKNMTIDTITMVNSTINDAAKIYNITTQIELSDCIMNVIINTPIIIAKDTTFNENVVATTPTLVNCTIMAILRQYQGPSINFLVQNCIFGPNAYHDIYSNVENTRVIGKWIGNVGQGSNPIRIDDTNLEWKDTDHTYTYEDNTGTFLPTVNSKTLDLEAVTTLETPEFPTTYQNKAYFINPGLVVSPAGLSWYSGVLLDLDAQTIPVFYIGNPEFDAEVEVSWKSHNGTFYDGNLYDGYGHAYAKRSFGSSGGRVPTTDKMRVWVQQLIQKCKDNTFSEVKATVTVTIKR